MRLAFLAMILFAGHLVLAQGKSSLSLSITNGGLIGDQLAAAYYFYGTTDPSDAIKFNETIVELDLRGEIQIKERVFLSLMGGYGFYRNRYDIDKIGSWGKSDQSFGRLGVGFLYKVNIEKLQIATGLEIPFYFVGAQTSETTFMDPLSASQFYVKLAGGFATGLTSVTSLRYFVFKKVFLAATVSFGPLYTSLGGGASEGRIDYVDPNMADSYGTADNNEYNSFKVSKPDFAFGAGITF